MLSRLALSADDDDERDDDETTIAEDWAESDGEDDTDSWDDDEPATRCRHWPARIYGQMPLFRSLVEAAMKATFEARPSLALYRSLMRMTMDPAQMEHDLFAILKNVATASSEIFAVALEIYALEFQSTLIVEILDSYSYLLRPRDAHALQAAVKVLATSGHSQRALSTVEAELTDSIRAIWQALSSFYSQLDDIANKTELAQILQLRHGGAARRDRIEAWVTAISSAAANVPNPMLFAAMMMGMPPVPGMGPDDDPYTYLDLDPLDPDLEDLRHEHRPGFKYRFESWSDTALTVNGGSAVLLKVYKYLIELMPFLRGTDVTEEMIAR